jgi:hypothetical protein
MCSHRLIRMGTTRRVSLKEMDLTVRGVRHPQSSASAKRAKVHTDRQIVALNTRHRMVLSEMLTIDRMDA